jgi:uncharacterized membrane protein
MCMLGAIPRWLHKCRCGMIPRVTQVQVRDDTEVVTHVPVGHRTMAELPALHPVVQRVMSLRTRRDSSAGSGSMVRHARSSSGPPA